MTTTSTAKDSAVVNGINVKDVRAPIDAVQTDPSSGMTHWKVASTWLGRTRSHAQVESFRLGSTEVPRRFSFDFDEPAELGGGNAFANPQEYLLGALNACMIVGYSALCALHGISLEKLEIESEGEIDLRGFLGLDPNVAAGYRSLSYTVRIKGDGTPEQFATIHDLVMATSPNFYNLSRAVALNPKLVVE
jgi:organic hydroperoxide reductase OsmC/OhrA